MFTKSDIRRVNIVIPAERYSELIIKIGDRALLHLDKEDRSESPALQHGLRKGGLSSFADIAAIIVSSADEAISGEGVPVDSGFDRDDELSTLFRRDINEDLRDVRRIAKRREKLDISKAIIEKQIASVAKQLDDLRMLRVLNIDFFTLNRLEHTSFLYGSVRGDSFICEMKDTWFYLFNDNMLFVMFPPQDRDELLNILKAESFNESVINYYQENPAEVIQQKAEKRMTMLKRRLERLESLYKANLQKSLERMFYFREIYRVILKISGAESGFLSSDELVVISGWLNIDDADDLRGLLRECAGESFYMRISSAGENRSFRDKIPVLLKNVRFFRPFELLVRMMGTPGNREVDPTPAAAIAYTVIFGVMFGDLGQGLTLAAAGLLLIRYGRIKHRDRNSVSDFGGIMTWCGLSAAVFGILYGSVFSNEHLIPAVLFHPMESMMELFLMAIMTGVILISSGLLFNVINGLLAGHYEEALFGTKGISGIAVYISAVYFIMRYILENKLPDAGILAAALLTPAVLFIFRGPLGYIFFHGEELFPHGLFEYLVESIVEIIEMFSGFLGNTISFIRAGAFALSHAGLSIAVFTLAEIIDPSMKSAGSIIAIITGNIFIILLEGLVCSIQSMRLEYYEFFGKFFKGDGVAFTPFSLKAR